MQWLQDLGKWLFGLWLVYKATLATSREKQRADEAESALDLDQRADKAGAAYDALSDADKLRYREEHDVYRD